MTTPLQILAETIAGHIRQPMTISEIITEINGDEYSAELMLQHILLWAASVEASLRNPNQVRAMILFGHIVLPDYYREVIDKNPVDDAARMG